MHFMACAGKLKKQNTAHLYHPVSRCHPLFPPYSVLLDARLRQLTSYLQSLEKLYHINGTVLEQFMWPVSLGDFVTNLQ